MVGVLQREILATIDVPVNKYLQNEHWTGNGLLPSDNKPLDNLMLTQLPHAR